MESILTSVKKHVGIDEAVDHFDLEIIDHVNSVFSDLNQLGVGPAEGFEITDNSKVWTDFVPNETLLRLNNIKSYIYLRVRLLFDPPTNSSQLESMNRQIEKLEWRINVGVETTSKEEIQNG